MSNHTLIHLTDPDGTEVVGIRMSNRPEVVAWLCLKDYERILANYPPVQWLLLGNGKNGRQYVRFYLPKKPRKTVSVARAVAGEYEATNIRYRDGNTLNLRRANLFLERGGGGVKRRSR